MHCNSITVSTKQRRIAELASQSPDMSFTSLAYLMDIDWLFEAYRQTRKNAAAGVDGVLEPSEVADCVIEALDEERFLILPHPKVLTYMQRKASDYDRWLGGMRRLRARFFGSV